MDTVKRVYRIECEWDIGHEYLVFTTKTAASAWVQANATFQEMAHAEGLTPEEFYLNVRGDELINYTRLEVNP